MLCPLSAPRWLHSEMSYSLSKTMIGAFSDNGPGSHSVDSCDAELEPPDLLSVPIESVPLGARVSTVNPQRDEYDFRFPNPDEETWVRIALTTSRQDGSIVDAELLRPRDWAETLGITVGAVINLVSEELEVRGTAEVMEMSDCPPLAVGKGEVVTGRFVTRRVDQTIVATFSTGDILEGTLIHPIWSPERQDFIPFGEFKVGDTVLGEQGITTIERIHTRTDAVPVYNLEVHGEHVYQVTNSGILVHNTCPNADKLYQLVAPNNAFPKDIPTKSTNNWSGLFKSEGEARNLARTKLGKNAVEIEPGKWRSADGKWQYRAKPGDLADNHIHLEELDPLTGEVLQNLHLRWPQGAGR